MGTINFWVVVIAIVSIVVFMFTYGTRTLWERSSIGRNLMLFPSSLLLIGLSGVSRRMDILTGFSQDVISIIGWVLVITFMTQRTKHVLKAQKSITKEQPKEQEDDPNER